jgi:hypothetical protein
MEETFKTIRLIHQLIILICTTICIYAISIEKPQNDYQAALEELNKLIPTLQEIKQTEEAFENNYYQQNGVVDVFKEVFKGKIDSNFKIKVAQEDDISKKTLQEIYDILDAKKGNWSFSYNELISFNLPKLKQNLEEIKQSVTTDQSDINFINLVKSAHFEDDGFDEKGEWVQFNTENPHIRSGGYEKIKAECITEKTKLNVKISSDLPIQRNLVVIADGKIITLPKLRIIWNNVRGLDIDGARLELKRQSDIYNQKNQEDLTLVGLKVIGRLAIIVAPILLLFLMLYLLSLISHALKISPSSDDLYTPFPWMGIMNNTVGKIMYFISVCLYPILSCFFIVISSQLNFKIKSELILFYTFPFTLVAIYTMKLSIRLRQKMVVNPVSNSRETSIY